MGGRGLKPTQGREVEGRTAGLGGLADRWRQCHNSGEEMKVSGETPALPACPLIPAHSSRDWDILPRAPWLPSLPPLTSQEHTPPSPAGARNGAVGSGQTEPADQRAGLLGDQDCRDVPGSERYMPFQMMGRGQWGWGADRTSAVENRGCLLVGIHRKAAWSFPLSPSPSLPTPFLSFLSILFLALSTAQRV